MTSFSSVTEMVMVWQADRTVGLAESETHRSVVTVAPSVSRSGACVLRVISPVPGESERYIERKIDRERDRERDGEREGKRTTKLRSVGVTNKSTTVLWDREVIEKSQKVVG